MLTFAPAWRCIWTDELEGGERAAFEAHLHECLRCASVVNAEQAFLDVIRRTEPLYIASEELRARVAGVMRRQPRSRWLHIHCGSEYKRLYPS